MLRSLVVLRVDLVVPVSTPFAGVVRGAVQTLKPLGWQATGTGMDRQQILALLLTFLMVGSSVAYAIAVL